VLPLVLKVAGLDYFAAYNLQAIWIPLAIALAAGLGARAAGRLGLGLAAALCAVFVATVIEVDANPTLQRYDFKGVARVLGPPTVPRAVVSSPQVGEQPLAAYMRRLEILPVAGASVSEVDIVGMHSQDESTRRRALGPPPRPSNPAFRLSGRADTDTFTIVRYRATRPVRVTYRELLPAALGDPPAAVALQSP
jgi:hypothetical protein